MTDIREFELPTDSDLSGYALFLAMDIIDKELRKEAGPPRVLTYVLFVASQGVGHAALVAAAMGPDIDLRINFEYDVDEWSLLGENFLPSIAARVHSNGA